MELLAGLLLLIGSAQISSGQNCDHLCYEIPENGFYLAGVAHGGAFLQNHCNCEVNMKTNQSIIVNCTGTNKSGVKNCPTNRILAEVSADSELQITITDDRLSSKSCTCSTETFAEPITSTATPIHHNATTQSHPLNALICNPYTWYIIGSQFVLLIVMLVDKLCQRRKGAMNNVPPPSKKSATPIEEIVEPTTRAAFLNPPLPSEAIYEEPIVNNATMRKVKIVVYEAHKMYENDSLTPQDDDPNNFYYSTVKI